MPNVNPSEKDNVSPLPERGKVQSVVAPEFKAKGVDLPKVKIEAPDMSQYVDGAGDADAAVAEGQAAANQSLAKGVMQGAMGVVQNSLDTDIENLPTKPSSNPVRDARQAGRAERVANRQARRTARQERRHTNDDKNTFISSINPFNKMGDPTGLNHLYNGPTDIQAESLENPYSSKPSRFPPNTVKAGNHLFGSEKERQIVSNMSGALTKLDPMHNGEPGVQKEDFKQFKK